MIYFHHMQVLLLTVSSILIVVAPITYIVSIARGTSKPHRMTRFILFFVLGLNFISILAARGNLGAQVFAGIVFLQAAIILFMSFWRGMGGVSVFDYVCLAIAAIGILGWKFTGNPVIGIWFSILADLSAYVPAFIKTWKHPDTESPWYYSLSGLAVILSLFAYKLDVSSVFQIYIGISCLMMIGFIYHKMILHVV
jgi:hypothetical protein